MADADFALEVPISFGHCDPAGIVFYPNFFRWFDRTFHSFLAGFGGHANLCEVLGSKGLGLIDVGAGFRSPARDGDLMRIEMRFAWIEHKSFRINYDGWIGDRLSVQGFEVRAVFVEQEGRMRAGAVAPLLDIIHASGRCTS